MVGAPEAVMALPFLSTICAKPDTDPSDACTPGTEATLGRIDVGIGMNALLPNWSVTGDGWRTCTLILPYTPPKSLSKVLLRVWVKIRVPVTNATPRTIEIPVRTRRSRCARRLAMVAFHMGPTPESSCGRG